MSSCLLSASILAADFANLGRDLTRLEEAGANRIHLDVMDGSFVPPITFGAQTVRALRPLTSLPFYAHLMVQNPQIFFADFIEAGADAIVFHIEACTHTQRALAWLKEKGVKAGISLVPSTPLEAIYEIAPDTDSVLVMTVNPGYGGQKMLDAALKKAERLVLWRNKHKLNFEVAVDGGINRHTAKQARQAGIDVLISGSSLFSSENMAKEAQILRGIEVGSKTV